MESSDKKKVGGDKSLWRNRWLVCPPEEKPNKEGNTVLVKELSFGPLEVFEWDSLKAVNHI